MAQHADATSNTVSWVSPHPQLWVATVNGEYLGMVEFTDGHFVANDTMRATYASFASLAEAKLALESPELSRLPELPGATSASPARSRVGYRRRGDILATAA
jgi:hypothetical protein